LIICENSSDCSGSKLSLLSEWLWTAAERFNIVRLTPRHCRGFIPYSVLGMEDIKNEEDLINALGMCVGQWWWLKRSQQNEMIGKVNFSDYSLFLSKCIFVHFLSHWTWCSFVIDRDLWYFIEIRQVSIRSIIISSNMNFQEELITYFTSIWNEPHRKRCI
jgi:hypothetical protein